MNTGTCIIAKIAIAVFLLASIFGCSAKAGTVTISSSDNGWVSPDGLTNISSSSASVTLTASCTNGTVSVTYTPSAGVAQTSNSGAGSKQQVTTFSFDPTTTQGVDNTIQANITHNSTDSAGNPCLPNGEQCTFHANKPVIDDESSSGGQSNATQDVHSDSIQANASGTANTQVQDVWFFSDGTGAVSPNAPKGISYPTSEQVQIMGVNPNNAGSINWSVQGQSNTLNFDNNQGSKTSNSLAEVIHSVGFSSSENNMYVQAVIQGLTIKSNKFTARCPALSGTPQSSTQFSKTTAGTPTYLTTFTYTMSDKFGDVNVPYLTICEIFAGGPGAWTNDYSGGNNWGAISPGNGYVFQNSQYPDFYSTGSDDSFSPVPAQGNSTLVRHITQTYKAGGSGTAGQSATGFNFDSFTLQERLNSATHN